MKMMATLFSVLVVLAAFAAAPLPVFTGPAQPAQPVKLIFIHHSTGENWLTDGYGDLGITLGQNNYFVSDTNYGWGPDAIGDRTDIPNWVEWFASDGTPRYMQALFTESEQHAPYTRTLADPGGENEIIVFKSCFPNSDLQGSPGDPPGTYPELSVGGAKYVYNEILKYFATRPDRMFVVITAPPLSDRSHAANARAFNQWLLNDWLAENSYTTGNVFVFDFYNVLTARDAHHRLVNGAVEYVQGNRDTLHYPSGDDHPSPEGSRKATEEFVPMLNLFYQTWRSSSPAAAPPAPAVENTPIPALQETETDAAPPAAAASLPAGVIDDFEAAAPAGTNGWEAFHDDATDTRITCTTDTTRAAGGSRSLKIEYDVAPASWATCTIFFDQPLGWSTAGRIAFAVQGGPTSLDVSLFSGPPEGRETYYQTIAGAASPTAWQTHELSWPDFKRVDWEENAGAAFTRTGDVTGIAFSLNAPQDGRNTGTIWIDDLRLTNGATQPAQPAPTQPPAESDAAQADETPAGGLQICGIGLLPLGLVFAGWRRRRAQI